MAKAYHNLAGLCRDLRHAIGDAAEGSESASKLVDDLNDLLDILDAGGGETSDGGPDDAGDGGIDDTEVQDVPMVRRTQGRVAGVGGTGQGPAVHSTRARARQEARPSRTQGVLCGTQPRAVPAVATAGRRTGGK